MENWFNLSTSDRVEIINQTSAQVGIIPTAIEKDFWVMISLKAIFDTKYGAHIVFKGGTSLSKGWNIIDRFSEDIDLGFDRSYFDFGGELTRSRVKKLRKTAAKFIDKIFVPNLKAQLEDNGIKDFNLSLIDFEESDTDPLSIELEYESLTDNIDYLKPRVLVELSSRSLRDPFELRRMRSFVGRMYPNNNFSDKEVKVPTVLPSRTMLEKIFLLHEEFQKPDPKKIRHQRMTRHLYDLGKLMDTQYLEAALNDMQLYRSIVDHRRMLIGLSWVNYDNHEPKYINFLPPDNVMGEWKQDYRNMQESMFYGATMTFENLINRLKTLQARINNL